MPFSSKCHGQSNSDFVAMYTKEDLSLDLYSFTHVTVIVILERSNDNWGEYTQVRGESARPERLGGVS